MIDPAATLRKEAEELKKSDKDPIDFAIEAIRINLAVWSYKDEKILFEAMKRLEAIKHG